LNPRKNAVLRTDENGSVASEKGTTGNREPVVILVETPTAKAGLIGEKRGARGGLDGLTSGRRPRCRKKKKGGTRKSQGLE